MKTRYKVQKLVTLKARATVGRVWETVGPREGFGRRTTAEHTQRNAMIDNPDAEVRITTTIQRPRIERAVW